MDKLRIQLEFLYLQIESLDEFALQNLKPNQREMQIRTIVSSGAIIMIRTVEDYVDYSPMEAFTTMINSMSNVLYPRMAASLNRCFEIKQQYKKYGEKVTQDMLSKLATKTVEDCYTALKTEVFDLPEKFMPFMQKGGMA